MTGRPKAHALETLRIMRKTFHECREEVELVGSPQELEAAVARGKLAAFIGLEGAHMYESDLETVRQFHDLGVRYVTLCHFFPNELVSSSNEKHPTVRGLTPFGIDVIRELNRTGSMVDLAHVHPASFYAAIEASTAPVIVSHGGCRALRDHHRNVTDDQIRAVARSGGIVGIIFFPWFLSRNPLIGPEAVADHIEHVARVAGVEHVSFGSDWDGFVWMPRFMPDAAALPRLTAELLRRFNEDDVRGILGGNFLRTWKKVHEAATDRRPILPEGSPVARELVAGRAP